MFAEQRRNGRLLARALVVVVLHGRSQGFLDFRNGASTAEFMPERLEGAIVLGDEIPAIVGVLTARFRLWPPH